MTCSAIETLVCRQCDTMLDADDNYCRHCGAATGHRAVCANDGAALTAVRANFAPAAGVAPSKWSEGPWVVLPLLFLVLGPLALPLLWRSRRFTPLWKTILTTLVLVLTAYLLRSVWVSLDQTLAPLRELDEFRGL